MQSVFAIIFDGENIVLSLIQNYIDHTCANGQNFLWLSRIELLGVLKHSFPPMWYQMDIPRESSTYTLSRALTAGGLYYVNPLSFPLARTVYLIDIFLMIQNNVISEIKSNKSMQNKLYLRIQVSYFIWSFPIVGQMWERTLLSSFPLIYC